ncbi:MAG: hypothetical protein IKI15_07835 [Lachnospiraceae bacterium]|nr:hypothetical protein [Lachnospiraceae bacterium]
MNLAASQTIVSSISHFILRGTGVCLELIILCFQLFHSDVFSLSKMEWGSNLLALKKDDPCYEADAIKGIQKYAYKCYVWLRSMTYGGEDTYTTVVYDGKIESLRLKSVALVRPAFTVPRDAKIEPYDGWVSGTQGFAFSCDKITDWK